LIKTVTLGVVEDNFTDLAVDEQRDVLMIS